MNVVAENQSVETANSDLVKIWIFGDGCAPVERCVTKQEHEELIRLRTDAAEFHRRMEQLYAETPIKE